MSVPLISVLQLSDTHIGSKKNGLNAEINLQRAIKHALSMQIRWDALILTGDLVESGSVDDYVLLKDLLQPISTQVPVYYCLGNHDSRENFKNVFKVFWDQHVAENEPWLQYSIGLGNQHQLIVMDSLSEGFDQGRLCADRLDWLRATLHEYQDQKIIVAIHHPPFIFGNSLFDAMAIQERDQFSDILIQHPNIDRVICGHLHRTMTAQIGHCPIYTSPSTLHAYGVDYSHTHRSGIYDEGAGFAFHQWLPEQGWISHSIVFMSPDY